MIRSSRFSYAALAAVTLLTGCEGVRDALTAHTETAARAERFELTASELGGMLGTSNAPLRKDVAQTLADIWVDYHLLGIAAARNDSLSQPAVVDSAMWAMLASNKAEKWYQRISAGWGRVDTAGAPRSYANGAMLAASHILLATQGAPDSVKRTALARARALRTRVSSGNFAELARANSQDPGSAQRGGSLGMFPRGGMIPEFERVVLALKPGEISGVVETPFGYHIIRRPTFDEVRGEFLEASRGMTAQRAESIYLARVDSTSRVSLKRGAAKNAKAAAAEPDAHRKDRTALASSVAGNFTSAQLVKWLETYPPQRRMGQQIQAAPDSAVEMLVRNFVRNELMIRAADSAGVRVEAAELDSIRALFKQQVVAVWASLGLDPGSLADSGDTPAKREDVTAARIESYMRALLADRVQFVQIPLQLRSVLRTRFDYRINSAGVDRALQIGTRLRGSADSARGPAAQPSVVPMPGQQGAQPPGPPVGPPGTSR